MAEKYGFFDAIVTNGVADRAYTADDINEIFSGVLSNGVVRNYTNALSVSSGSGMSVNVNTGKAIVNNHWYVNESVKNVTINTAHPTLNRYTRIIVRFTQASRTIGIVAVDGTPAATPVEPSLTQTDDVYEIPLALVYVGAGVTSITSNNITDNRSYVAGLTDPTPLNFRMYNYTQENAGGQTNFDLPVSYNYTPDTKLMVYNNGLLCQESEYTIQINEVEGNYMVVFPTARVLGTEMSFIMLN